MPLVLLQTILWIAAMISAIWVIYEVWAEQKGMKVGMKVVWTVCAIFFSIITAIVYYFAYKRK